MLIAFALRMQLARRTCSLSVGHGEPLALPVFPTQVGPGASIAPIPPGNLSCSRPHGVWIIIRPGSMWKLAVIGAGGK